MRTITDYEIIDHGIEYADYFQGCGVSFTSYDNVVTGIGDNPREALDDCLEQIAQFSDYDLTQLDVEVEKSPTDPCVEYPDNADGGMDDVETPWYHVSVRWN